MPGTPKDQPQRYTLHRKLDRNLQEAQRMFDALERHLRELRIEAERIHLKALRQRTRQKPQ